MRTIFIIIHGASTYGSESNPKIAFERKEDAQGAKAAGIEQDQEEAA